MICLSIAQTGYCVDSGGGTMRSSWGVNLPPLLHITTTHHMQTQTLSTWLSLAFVAALTTGCGGGGSDAAPAAAATSTAPVAIALPTPTASTPATAATAGTLPFAAFISNDASTLGVPTTQNVAITGAGASSVMTFTSPAFTLTGAAGGTATFSANGGQVKADGNVVSYCSAGKQTTFGATEGINKPFQNGHRVFLSANLTPVTNLAEINGKRFSLFNCTGTDGKMTFNAAGDGAAYTSASDNQTIPAAVVAQWFSDAGVVETNGSGSKMRLYKHTAAGVSKYYILFIDKYSGGGVTNVGYLGLLSQD